MSETRSFDPSKLPGGNAMFPSSGDPDSDARIAADIRLRAGRDSEGLCPNACGPIIVDSPTKRHCDVCGFVGERFVLGAG